VMIQKKIIILTLIFCLVILAASCSPKIAYVNKSVLLTETAISRDARAGIQTKLSEYQLEIKKQEDEILALKRLLEKSKNKEEISVELNEKLSTYEEYVKTVNTAIQELENEIMQPVYSEINKALDAFGKKNGYYMIFSATTSGNILFVDDEADITEKVIQFIDSAPEYSGKEEE
jgi:outer membrane protein